MHGKSEIA